MSSHPDANAFIAAILRDPAEVTTRLVFADWLEETGTPSNVAWAHFIRMSAEANQIPADFERRGELERQLSDLIPQIHAKLTVEAAQLVGKAEHLNQLLPRANITVRLAGYEVHRAVIELVPESVARENLVLSLHAARNRLLIATTDPTNYDTIEKLAFILNRDIVTVQADRAEICAAIDYHYGQTETEVVACVSYESPLVGLDGDLTSMSIFSIFHTAFSENCSAFEMTWDRPECVLRYAPRTALAAKEHQPREVFTRLLHHFLSRPVEAEYVRDGVRCRDFDIPLLSGRRCPATLERRRGILGTTWFRVRFRWEDGE